MKRQFLTLTTILVGLVFNYSCYKGKDLSDIISQSEQASFIIYTYDEFGSPSGSGTGFFIDKSGIAITNYHVLDGAVKAVIVTSDSSKYEIEKTEFEIDFSTGELTKFTGYYTCVWFDETQKPNRQKFHENALERVN